MCDGNNKEISSDLPVISQTFQISSFVNVQT